MNAPFVAEALWTPWDRPGLDHAWLRDAAGQITFDGLALVVDADRIVRVSYTIACDADWRVRAVDVAAGGRGGRREAHLRSDGAGHWTTANGAPLPLLDGCLDVDLAFSPVTNTLPVRRLALRPGASAEFVVVYLALPELRPEPDEQRYTCLDPNRYLYESADGAFRAELPVDRNGLVRDYPGLFRRID